MRCRLLHGMAGGDALASLPPAKQAERRRGHEPIGQDGESLPARMTYSAAHPNAFVLVVVGVAEPPPVPDDGVVKADGTSPRQKFQRNHPGSMLSFACGSAIKRITAGVQARRDRSLLKFDLLAEAFTLRQSQFQTKKEYCFLLGDASARSGHWPV